MSDWVAGITLLVSVVTLYYVVRTDRREKRHAPYVALSLTSEAEAMADGELQHYIWALTNIGSADARISVMYGVNCQLVFSNEYPPVQMVRAGETERVAIKVRDVEQAWMLVGWAAPHDRKWWFMEWFAPDHRSALKQSFKQRRPWNRRLPQWLRRKLSKPEPVGPGGVVGTRLRQDSRVAVAEIEVAMSLAKAAEASVIDPRT